MPICLRLFEQDVRRDRELQLVRRATGGIRRCHNLPECDLDRYCKCYSFVRRHAIEKGGADEDEDDEDVDP